MDDSCVAWSVCNDPNNEIRPAPSALLAFGNLFPRLDFLIQLLYSGRSSVLFQFDVPCCVQAHGRLAPFSMEPEEEWVVGEGVEWEWGRGIGRRRERGNWGRYVK